MYYYTYSISFILLLSVSAINNSTTWYVSDNGSGSLNNIWYVSDYGSDDNDCHSARIPCKNLQTVLDRATDGADIYVMSPTLSLGMIIKPCFGDNCCTVESSISYTITTYNETYFTPTCYSKSNHISFL